MWFVLWGLLAGWVLFHLLFDVESTDDDYF